MKKNDTIRATLGGVIFEARWMLYPINIGLLIALGIYVLAFLANDYHFVVEKLSSNEPWELESLMVLLLGFVDASMVANLIIMIVQGGHQIFINKFNSGLEKPQYLDHIDTGILKVKVAQSIASITLVQLLKDFVSIEKSDWSLVQHKVILHCTALASTLVMAIIWRIMHPTGPHVEEPDAH